VPGPPLGVVHEAAYDSTEVVLPASSTLLLYTDGLIERRGEPVDVGLNRLCSVTANVAPEQVCRDVMLRLVGSRSTIDDVALLAIGRGDLPEPDPVTEALLAELSLEPDPSVVAQARAFALRAAGDISASVRGTLSLLVSELATNCVVHAASEFTVRIFRGPDRLRVECVDSGAGSAQLYEAAPSETHGRGLFIVQNLADDWGERVNEPGPGKTVWFVLSLATPTDGLASA